MRVVTFNGVRKALSFGSQKINLNQHGSEFEPKARSATPGAGDLCFVTEVPLSKVIAHLNECHIEVLEGPVQRSGAVGKITLLYFRDPDGNLLEVASYLEERVECLS